MTAASAGWYPDPEDPRRVRYWSGTGWTTHVHAPADATDVPALSPEPAAQRSWVARHKVVTTLGVLAGGLLLIGVGSSLPPAEDDPVPIAVATTDSARTPPSTPAPTPTPTPTPTPEPDPVVAGFLAAGLDEPTPSELQELRDTCVSVRAKDSATLGALADTATASRAEVTTRLDIVCPKAATALRAALRDSDGDGKRNFEDDYARDPGRWTTTDRDGDGVPNKTDVAPTNPDVSSWDSGVVTRVVDGDTVEVAGIGTIRVIGIDTPERGECGYDKASQVMATLVLDRTVTLVPGARDDVDRYDRLLRYVDVDGTDAGLQLIRRGFAIARYDSRDGYGSHTREARYIDADATSPDRTNEFCPAAPPPPPPPPAGGGSEPWNQPGPDLDCADIGQRVIITGPDYHGLDRDGDGVGCDSYG